MPAAEFDAALKSLALSEDDLEEFALNNGVTPGILRDWALGAVPIPPEKTEWIEVAIDGHRRWAALRDSGLPECEWMKTSAGQISALAEDENLPRLLQHIRRLKEHDAACPVCQARTRFIETRFGPIDDPPKPWWRREYAVIEHAPLPQWVPKWARPAARGVLHALRALVIAGVLALPIFLIPGAVAFAWPVMMTALLPGAATLIVAMAMGGLAMSFTRIALRRFPTARAYASGIIAVVAFAGTWAVAARVVWGANAFAEFELAGAAKFAAQMALLGVMFGYTMKGELDDDEPEVD